MFIGNLVISCLSSRRLRTTENAEKMHIVILTSLGFKMAPYGIPFGELKTRQDKGFKWSWFRDGQSKLARR
jgi:hypothetical protein